MEGDGWNYRSVRKCQDSALPSLSHIAKPVLLMHCPFTAHLLPIYCPCTAHVLPMHGPCTTHVLPMHCPCTAHLPNGLAVRSVGAQLVARPPPVCSALYGAGAQACRRAERGVGGAGGAGRGGPAATAAADGRRAEDVGESVGVRVHVVHLAGLPAGGFGEVRGQVG